MASHTNLTLLIKTYSFVLPRIRMFWKSESSSGKFQKKNVQSKYYEVFAVLVRC